MKKALIVTTVSGFVPQFEMNNVKILKEMGYEIHYASNYNMPVYTDNNKRLDGTGIIRHQIDFERSPFKMGNIKAYKQLNKLMKEDFEIVHCHTPVGGAIARLAAHRNKIKKVVYTAHGFHFFKGAPKLNKILFYIAEHYLARYSDAIITINEEDYKNAKKFKLKKNGNVYKISGVGMHLKNICKIENNRSKKRSELGVNSEDIFLMLSVGELTKRKNHQIVIKAIAELNNPKIKYLICGTGVLEEYLKELIKSYKLEKQVILMGYRTDITEILKVVDCFIFPSLQEGLPVAVMEAMAVGRSIIASNVRGNNDLIVDGKGGYLVEPLSIEKFAKKIEKASNHTKEQRKNMEEFNLKIIERYDINIVDKQMREIYTKLEENL